MNKKSTYCLSTVCNRPHYFYILLCMMLFGPKPSGLMAQTVSRVYDTAGTYTFVDPPCVTSVQVQVGAAAAAAAAV